jgi:hypothetical protein
MASSPPIASSCLCSIKLLCPVLERSPVFPQFILHIPLFSNRLKVSQNRVLRISGLRREEVVVGWRKQHNEELHNLYPSPNIIRTNKSSRMRWAGHVACMREKRNAYRIFVDKPQGKIPSARPRHRWEDNIKMDLREVGCSDMDWIHLAQDRDQWRTLVNTVTNLRVPQNVGKFLSS